MAVTRASAAAAKTLPTSKEKKPKHKKSITTSSTSSVKRNMSPGIRLIGGRIYDSENGKTCHQCRQKTLDFSVSCKNIADKKQCTFHYCHICLLNRYGEKAEAAAALGCTWKCPRCRGICNCNRCMKQRGCRPTGVLLPIAKANGFSSVSEMLHSEEIKKPEKDEGAYLKKRKASNEEPVTSSKLGRRKVVPNEKSNSMCLDKSLEAKDDMKGTMTKKMSTTRKADGKVKFSKGKTIGDATVEKTVAGCSVALREVDGKDNFANANIKGVAIVEKRITRSSTSIRKVPMGQEEANIRANCNLKQREKGLRQLSNAEDIEAAEPVNVKIRSSAEKTVGEGVQHSWKAAVDADNVKVLNEKIPLPQGTNLTKVANVDFAAEDVGHALQFLEFCEAFGQVTKMLHGLTEHSDITDILDLKKGQSEFLLQELTCCQNTRRRCDLSLERLHIKLLSMIQNDSDNGCATLKAKGRNSWFEALVKLISECPYISKELNLSCSHLSREGYQKLECSEKLRILTFLCDEALSTSELRIWIDAKNLVFVEERKKAKKMLLHQEKNARMKLENEVANAILLRNGAPLSIAEHQNLVSKIKVEVSKSLQAPPEVPQPAVVRSNPILSDAYGRKFWKLKSHSGEIDVLLQDVAFRDQITSEEKWLVYDVHEKANIERYIRSVKNPECAAV